MGQPSWVKQAPLLLLLSPPAAGLATSSYRTFFTGRDSTPSPTVHIRYHVLGFTHPSYGNVHIAISWLASPEGLALLSCFAVFVVLLACWAAYISHRLARESSRDAALAMAMTDELLYVHSCAASAKSSALPSRKASSGSLPVLSKAASSHTSLPMSAATQRRGSSMPTTLAALELSPGRVVACSDLSHGRFGPIKLGTLHDPHATGPLTAYGNAVFDVAIWVCSARLSQHQTEFSAILTTMAAYNGMSHPNVLRLLGVVSTMQPSFAVVEYCAKGNLAQFLRSQATAPVEGGGLTLSRRLRYGSDVARGMAFLSNQGFVHHSLQARHCLVHADGTIKISGFDQCHRLNCSPREAKASLDQFPVRWLSPQALADGTFSTKGDIWSYGVLLWECCSFAREPYTGLSNEEVYEGVQKGLRLSQPMDVPDDVFSIMQRCWHMSPRSRPDFEDLLSQMQGG